MISKSRLINLTNPGINISDLKSENPKVHQAIKDLGDGTQQLVHAVFPPPPTPSYRGRIIIPGILTPAEDILSHRYHVVLPSDPSGYWKFVQINLTDCYITAKVVPSTDILSIDILVSQKKGTTPYKSLFQPGFNPMLPIGVVSTHNVKFAINNLYQDDLGRVDIIASDAVTANVEVVLVGNYSLLENKIG